MLDRFLKLHRFHIYCGHIGTNTMQCQAGDWTDNTTVRFRKNQDVSSVEVFVLVPTYTVATLDGLARYTTVVYPAIVLNT